MSFIDDLITRYPLLAPCQPEVSATFAALCSVFRRGGKLLVCGNGGSAADGEHIVGELMKGFLRLRPLPEGLRQRLLAAYPQDGAYLAENLQGALPALSLASQTALLTAFSNDVAADLAFAQQVYGYGRAGDALLARSTSGNSKLVIHAAQVARLLGLTTLGLTGKGGGRLAPLCDVCVCVPDSSTHAIQERHLAIYHALCAALEEEFFAA
jgi:D-sedoheptulose 7-phosphate isomerase